MRIREIIFEDDDLSHLVQDDSDEEINYVLADTLRELQMQSGHAKIPKISVEALINLVKMKPGGEAFGLEALQKASKNDDTVKNLIADIKDDQHGVKFVFINPVDPVDDNEFTDNDDHDAVKTQPEKTVGKMAKRALSKRD